MFYFPRSDDTKALKYLIKKGIIDYNGKDDSLRKATIRCKGSEAGEYSSYNYNFTYDHLRFDEENIYHDKDLVSLAEILVHTVIRKSDLDDNVREIVESRALYLQPVLMGITNALFYESESFASEDIDIPAYEVVTELEEKRKDK